MGFESKFTLYRKYNVKASAEELKSIVAEYVKYDKEHDYSNVPKSDEEYAKDLPNVLDPQYAVEDSAYDESTNEWKDMRDHSIVGQRKNFNYVLASDGSHLDELLCWNFCSSFDCLYDVYHLGHRRNDRDVLIDKATASKILQACSYLLSGKYSDEFEQILDNEWISILADGNSSDSYWSYVYRNDKKRLNDIPFYERYEMKPVLERVKDAMSTYLKADTSGKSDDATLILVYSYSC